MMIFKSKKVYFWIVAIATIVLSIESLQNNIAPCHCEDQEFCVCQVFAVPSTEHVAMPVYSRTLLMPSVDDNKPGNVIVTKFCDSSTDVCSQHVQGRQGLAPVATVETFIIDDVEHFDINSSSPIGNLFKHISDAWKEGYDNFMSMNADMQVCIILVVISGVCFVLSLLRYFKAHLEFVNDSEAEIDSDTCDVAIDSTLKTTTTIVQVVLSMIMGANLALFLGVLQLLITTTTTTV